MRCIGNDAPNLCCNWYLNDECYITCPPPLIGDTETYDCGEYEYYIPCNHGVGGGKGIFFLSKQYAVLSGCCLKNPQSKQGPDDCVVKDSYPHFCPQIELEDYYLH